MAAAGWLAGDGLRSPHEFRSDGNFLPSFNFSFPPFVLFLSICASLLSSRRFLHSTLLTTKKSASASASLLATFFFLRLLRKEHPQRILPPIPRLPRSPSRKPTIAQTPLHFLEYSASYEIPTFTVLYNRLLAPWNNSAVAWLYPAFPQSWTNFRPHIP